MKPYNLTTHDGKRVDLITKQALQAAEEILGYELSITQGSYNAGGVSASAGTHDGGGVVDLKAWDWDNKVRALRKVGFAAWHRPAIPGLWGEHVHAVLIGNAKLAPSAARQVASYARHRDGLKGDAFDPFPFHPDGVVFKFQWPTLRSPKRRVQHLTPYRHGNSHRGDVAAKKAGYKWVDRDCQITSDGIPINAHWGLVHKDGFTGKGIPSDARYKQLTRAEVARLRSRDGYVVRSMSTRLHHCARLGLNVEIEAKFDPRFQRAKTWKMLRAAARAAYGDDWAKHVVVKTLTEPGGMAAAKARLRAAHAAGFTTILLCKGTSRFKVINEPFITYTRGNLRTPKGDS